MPEELSFVDLVRLVRAGDEAASTELVRHYEPAIRITVHGRLTDRGLRRRLDSMDICQSVLGNFFVRASAGEFELDRPEQLMKLLITMARNRLTDYALRQRDYRRTAPLPAGEQELADHGPSPSEVVAGKELLRAFRGKLSADELRLADQRALGRPWAEIAAEVGASPDALRVQLGRAVDRVARELRLDD
jgi:DNA-directed RNA polymerase specialized sigma24 family protein